MGGDTGNFLRNTYNIIAKPLQYLLRPVTEPIKYVTFGEVDLTKLEIERPKTTSGIKREPLGPFTIQGTTQPNTLGKMSPGSSVASQQSDVDKPKTSFQRDLVARARKDFFNNSVPGTMSLLKNISGRNLL